MDGPERQPLTAGLVGSFAGGAWFMRGREGALTLGRNTAAAATRKPRRIDTTFPTRLTRLIPPVLRRGLRLGLPRVPRLLIGPGRRALALAVVVLFPAALGYRGDSRGL